MNNINVISAERYVVVAETDCGDRKLFQILFSKKDGSLFVTFPYLKGFSVRVGTVLMPAGIGYHEQFCVGKNFPVSAHLVKYSHHPSGQAHFSLTNKVRTAIRKDSVPLSKLVGHIFTVRVQGFSHFEKLEKSKVPLRERMVIPFSFAEKDLESLKFVCHYYAESELKKRFRHYDGSPWTRVDLPGGAVAVGIALTTPFFFEGQRRYLFLGAERAKYAFNGIGAGISFMGGFDDEETVLDLEKESSCLMMFAHNIDNYTELVETVGTIDL